MRVIHGDLKRPKTEVIVQVENFEQSNKIRDWIEDNIDSSHLWTSYWTMVTSSERIYEFQYEKDAAFFALQWQ